MIIYNVTNDAYIKENTKNWYHMDKDFFIIGNNREIKKLDNIFKFDPYTILECVNLDENIRFDSYPDYDFISLIYFYLEKSVDSPKGEIIFSEINIYVGKNYLFLVLPVNEKIAGDFTNHFRNARGLCQSTDYFLIEIYYKIFDKILKSLFETMEKYEDILDEYEINVLNQAKKEYLYEIIKIKGTTGKIKKLLRPLLQIGDQFIINENNYIPPDKMKYFKNIDIRINKIYDFAVNLSEMSEQLLYVYDSKINMQTNEIITKLTIITVFIGPLTVITGIYGMNFDYMPELGYRFSYFIVLTIMLVIAVCLYLYFRKKKYL